MKFNAATLTAARESAGLSKPELAVKARVGIATVYDIERGDIKTPSSDVVTKLAEACGVDWRDFYADNLRQNETPAAS